MGLKKGLIQVYTGDGKGKTTAALGLAFRAIGRGLRVVMIQFMKGEHETGELNTAKRLAPDLVIKPIGREGFINSAHPTSEDISSARAGLEEADRILKQGLCDVLILDEINVAVSFGLLEEAPVLRLMSNKPGEVELVLTGRGAPSSFLEKADLVTTMTCTKHYFDFGEKARIGIEF